MKKVLFIAICVLFVTQTEAYAYINPGTGSDFFQMFVGIVLGVAKFFKNIVCKIKSIFSKKTSKNNNDKK